MKKSIQVSQCSRLQPQSPPRYGSGTGSMPFPHAPVGAQWIQAGFGVVGGDVGDVLDVWPNEVVQGFRSGRKGASETRVRSRNTPSEAKPGFLWTCEPVLSPAATTRVFHRPPDCTRRSPHSSAHLGTLWCWLSSRLWRC